ncbi:MAG TPA: WXG100 family type VII secretion target [Acetivibrio clariflavus]|nr:WXG100 family type VII secretion target [Acetivibrio clariflavus]
MSQFQVTPEVLRNTSGSLKSVNSKIKSIMENIDKDMKSTQKVWESEAANTFISKFEKLKKNFETYYQVIASYAKFLEDAAQSYEGADTNINTSSKNLFA